MFARLLVLLLVSLPLFADDPVRLYALDCGSIEPSDMGMFSDTLEYDGKPGRMSDPCFLVLHPNGTLLWDAGLPDALNEHGAAGVDMNGIRLRVPVTLASQLRSLGLTPRDITHIAFSHLHFDHTGNANAFVSATWILNRAELDWALSEPAPFGVDPASFAAHKNAKTQLIDRDHDVFGDGRVRIFAGPGHTPGSQFLAVTLAKSGTVVLSGDLLHTNDNRAHQRVPRVNHQRADSLASIDRLEKIVRHARARLIIQHEPAHFAQLPKFPAYLD